MKVKKSNGNKGTKIKILTKKVPFEFLAPDAQKVYLAGAITGIPLQIPKKDKGYGRRLSP
jgi:hypothetical protein